MKKNTLFILSLIALGTLLLGACVPLETVATETAPAEVIVETTPIPVEPIIEATEFSANPPAPTATPANNGNQDNQGNSMQDQNGNGNYPSQEDGDGTPSFVAAEALTEAELEGLSFMREEEKLARDVYLTLYDEWGLSIFQNIASSEQQHTDAVKGLLEFYGATDPVTDDTIGVFANEDLQALYDQLVEKGSLSLVDAIEVGTAIEEIDILDLQEFIATTENPNIIMVYNNLLKGSYNHLRAFVSQYERQSGESFEPSYMTLEGYNDALSSANSGQGGGNRGGHGKN